MTSEKSKKNPKKKFTKPSLKSHGNIMEISQTASKGGPGDGGGAPFDRKGTCLTPVPEITEHHYLIKDIATQNLFRKQIEQTVKPGDVVLDLGIGTGVHTLFALKAGAKKVYAVDMSPIIEMAKQNIAANGYSDKVEFHQCLFKDLQLPEKVDVIISNIGFLNTMSEVPACIRAFLKPEGRCLPDMLQIHFSPISAEDMYDRNVSFWNQKHMDLDLSAMLKMARSYPSYAYYQPEQLLTDSPSAFQIDLKSLNSKSFHWQMSFEVSKDEVCHGIGGFYDFICDERIYLSTRPPHQLTREIWYNFLFPCAQPFAVKAGDVVTADIQMFLAGTMNPVWKWAISVDGKEVTKSDNFSFVQRFPTQLDTIEIG